MMQAWTQEPMTSDLDNAIWIRGMTMNQILRSWKNHKNGCVGLDNKMYDKNLPPNELGFQSIHDHKSTLYGTQVPDIPN